MKEPLRVKRKGEKGKGVNYLLKQEEKEFLRALAIRIREIRTEAGVTQEKFYDDTNIHIGRIETGKYNISLSTLYRVCSYFNISIKDFFGQIKKR